MFQMISLLREKEETYHLEQTSSIDELERRIQHIVFAPKPSFDLTM